MSLLLLGPLFSLAAQPGTPRARGSAPTLVFMTDFGLADDSVAICKAVMLSICPDLRIMDITHQVKPFSILDGARFLAGTSPYYGSGTVFVAVVDPTVGSTRRALVVKSRRGQYFVLPDNGLITLVQDRDGIEGAREITNRAWTIGTRLSSTFHGRDVFSPVGAHLARGEDWTLVGPLVGELVRTPIQTSRLDPQGLTGDVVAIDRPFGNLITNIGAEDFLALGYAAGERVPFRLGSLELLLPFVKTFSEVPRGASLLYIDSRGHLGVAVNEGSAESTYGIAPPVPIRFSRVAP